MPPIFVRFARLAALAACLFAAAPGFGQGVPGQGVPGQGVPGQGVPGQGVPGQGASGQGVALSPPAAAQDVRAPSPAEPEQARGKTAETLDQAKSVLDQVQAALRRNSLDDAMLAELRGRLDPVQTSVLEAIERLVPRVALAKERVDKLGPKPDGKAPPESADVATAREQETQRFNRADELLKRGQVLALQLQQTSDRIASRRRALFVNTLFKRSYSLASPSLWIAAGHNVARDLRAVATIASDFFGNAADRLGGLRLPAFLGLAILLALANVPLYRYVRGILRREPLVEEPSRLRKALGACWTALIIAVPPIATVLLLFALLDAFELMTGRVQPIRRALLDGVVSVAVYAGVARGLFAPSRPHWRLAPMSNEVADRLTRLAVALVVIVSAVNVVEALSDAIGSSLSTTAVIQGLGAAFFAIVLGGGIFGLGDEDDSDEECLGPRVTPRPAWIGALRLATWTVIATIAIAVLFGYIPIASFLSEQFIWTSCVVMALGVLTPLATSAIEAGFQPTSRLGRGLVSSVGLRREGVTQLGIVLSGILQMLLPAFGLLAIIAPWGLQSDDLMGGLRTAYFGFKVGDVTISLSSLLVGLVVFGIGYGVTRAIQGWLDRKLMPATSLDTGLRNSIRTSVGYVGLFVAAAAALAQIGLGIQQIALVAGALSIGIGLGLQMIVTNFVSGLILLWERSVRVGDWIVVGGDQGYVRKINVRATEIETFERSTVIIPNSNLIGGVVKNWLRQDRVGRVNVNLTLGIDVDPEQVREIMTGAARAHESVSKIPAPSTMLSAIAASGLTFDLYCFVDDVTIASRTASDLRFAIFKGLKEARIPIGPSVTQVVLQGEAAAAIADAVAGAKAELTSS